MFSNFGGSKWDSFVFVFIGGLPHNFRQIQVCERCFLVPQTQEIIHFLLCWKDVFHPNDLHIEFLLISINFTPRNWPYWPQNGESNFFQAVYHGMSLVDYGVMVPPFWYDWNPICLECIFETRKYLTKKQHPFHFEKKNSHTYSSHVPKNVN